MLLTISCASTPEIGSFDRSIANGMDKDQVLTGFGTPNLTKRRNGMDVWQFYFYNGDNKTIKEVHFKDGKVIYRGSPVLPKSNETAKAVDERNSRANAALSAAGGSSYSSTLEDTESTASKVNRMKQEFEAELPNKKPNYQELE